MEHTSAGRRGRPESRVDPEDGPAAVFAVELRGLRERAGRPSYRDMSRLAFVSASALSEAARGQRWPSWQVVAGYVTACGEDPEAWRARWEALRPPTEKAQAAKARVVDGPPGAIAAGSPESGPPEETGSEPGSDGQFGPDPEAGTGAEAGDVQKRTARPGPVRRGGRLAGIGAGVAVIVAVVGVVAATWRATPAPPPKQAGVTVAATATTASVATASSAPVPVRRHGTLVMLPGQVADLDSTAANWEEQPEPGPSTADVWFGAQDHALHGVGDNDIAVLAPGSAGGFWPCALEQDYGVTLAAAEVRPERVLCGLTAANRVAQLRITGVTYDAVTGQPDRVIFDVTVWVPQHKT